MTPTQRVRRVVLLAGGLVVMILCLLPVSGVTYSIFGGYGGGGSSSAQHHHCGPAITALSGDCSSAARDRMTVAETALVGTVAVAFFLPPIVVRKKRPESEEATSL
jgi:ABC-type Fe3+ transport system permease subunit